MKLNQISPSDPVSARALEGFQETAPILKDAEFYSKAGAADSVKQAREGSTTKITRALNVDNNATPPTPAYVPATKRIVSFDAKVDVVIEDRNEDPVEELSRQTYLEARDAGFLFQEMMFEGSNANDSTSIDGMRNKVGASQVITPSSAIVLALGNSDTHRQMQQEAVEAFLSSAARVVGGATHAYMNALLKARWLTIAKELGFYRLSKDELGAEVDMIANIIIREAGHSSDGTPLIPFDETLGGHTKTTSIFFARWGEGVDLTCLTSVGLKGRYAGQNGNFITNNINMDMDLVLQNPKALWQHKGWALEEAA